MEKHFQIKHLQKASGGADDFNREALGIEVDFSLSSARIVRALEQIMEWRGQAAAIRCDNGPENISGLIQAWADRKGIRLDPIQPGKPQPNDVARLFWTQSLKSS